MHIARLNIWSTDMDYRTTNNTQITGNTKGNGEIDNTHKAKKRHK